mmetsp:Transcript_3200/g.7189  ORF Transcript_3200/g.7189 Transcript_3200/m.7189 type:complete len:262 (+) Transcript_3200:707-1492(+)
MIEMRVSWMLAMPNLMSSRRVGSESTANLRQRVPPQGNASRPRRGGGEVAADEPLLPPDERQRGRVGVRPRHRSRDRPEPPGGALGDVRAPRGLGFVPVHPPRPAVVGVRERDMDGPLRGLGEHTRDGREDDGDGPRGGDAGRAFFVRRRDREGGGGGWAGRARRGLARVAQAGDAARVRGAVERGSHGLLHLPRHAVPPRPPGGLRGLRRLLPRDVGRGLAPVEGPLRRRGRLAGGQGEPLRLLRPGASLRRGGESRTWV